jgi:hypothetical protein
MEKNNNKKNRKTATANKTKKENHSKKVNPKPTKKANLNENATIQESPSEIKKLIKIILIITAIMAILYVVTLIATNKAEEVSENTTQEKETTKAEIQYENIMIGTMLNKNGTYYVLIEDTDDNRVSEYETIIQTIKATEDPATIYIANLTDSFNKKYLAKEKETKVDNIENFKVNSTTLVKIADNKIDSVYDNYDAIKNKLNELL